MHILKLSFSLLTSFMAFWCLCFQGVKKETSAIGWINIFVKQNNDRYLLIQPIQKSVFRTRQASMKEPFAEIVNGCRPLNILTKHSIMILNTSLVLLQNKSVFTDITDQNLYQSLDQNQDVKYDTYMLSRHIYSQSCKLEHQINLLNVVLSVFKAGNDNTTTT